MPFLSNFRSTAAIGLVGALLFAPAAFAQSHDHGGGDGGDKSDAQKKGKQKGHNGGMMMGHMGALPGSEVEKCHGHDGMPPHYCEPVYNLGSSVRGAAIEDVAAAGDQSLMVTLREVNVTHPGVAQKIVIIAGAGDLAGSVVVEGGWKERKRVQLTLIGDGTIYSQDKLHVHIFPLTSP